MSNIDLTVQSATSKFFFFSNVQVQRKGVGLKIYFGRLSVSSDISDTWPGSNLSLFRLLFKSKCVNNQINAADRAVCITMTVFVLFFWPDYCVFLTLSIMLYSILWVNASVSNHK